jgi:hypothetical protein
MSSLKLIKRRWTCPANPNWLDIHPTISSFMSAMIYLWSPGDYWMNR